MKYRHRFEIQAPLAEVAAFHAQSASMAAITPPPVVVQIHNAPEHLTEGDTMDFSLWLGPLPISWLAQIEQVSPTGFVDRQLQGPFQSWVHRHSFRPVGEEVTEVIDDIELSLRPHLWWGLVGFGMRLSLPFLFAYRAWRTRQLVEKQTLAKNSDKFYSEGS